MQLHRRVATPGPDRHTDINPSALPFVSVVIPCRNEAKYIRLCLDSILANEYPKDRLEVLVVDGVSEDGTRAIVQDYAQRQPVIRLLDNPRKKIPSAMNIGIKQARGEIVMKVDAHSVYAADYVSKSVRYLREYNTDSVGGILVTKASGDTPVAKAIALALAHPFGSGNSHFRVGSREPRWADTAAFGCYRREVFTRVGFYNEDLVRSSDMDLNTRFREAGGKILLVPDIVAYYYPSAGLKDFLVCNIMDGFWALYPLRFGGRGIRLRHVVPLACGLIFLVGMVAAAINPICWWVEGALIGAYGAASVVVSARVASRERQLRVLGFLPVVFAVRHVAYAIGSLWGSLRVVLSPSFWRSLTRSSS